MGLKMVLKNLFNYNLLKVTVEDVKNDRYVILASTKTKKSYYITNHSGYYPDIGHNCHMIVDDENKFVDGGIEYSEVDINFNKLLLSTVNYKGLDYIIKDIELSEIIHHTDKMFELTLNYDREILKITNNNTIVLFDKMLDHFKGLVR